MTKPSQRSRDLAWEQTSRAMVLSALQKEHPQPRLLIVEEKRFKDPDEFAMIWAGTIADFKRRGWIVELPKQPKTMFRGFRLTQRGLRAAKRKGAL